MGVEIERKYLIRETEWRSLSKPAGTPVTQGYLLSGNHLTIRIRTTDTKGYITLKGATNGFSRQEFEYEIPLDEASAMIDGFSENAIKKIRYCIEYEGKTWEADEFLAENEGLLMAEIELDSEQEPFELPPWVGAEVTGDKRYYNSYLSAHPFKEWNEQ